MKTLKLGLTSILGAVLFTGCMSAQELAMIDKTITATETEVAGCTFLGDVDVGPRATIQGARAELKLEAAKLGGTHLVETHAYAGLIGFYPDFGVGLSGRAYKCPVGLGPKVSNEKGEIQFEMPNLRAYEEPHSFD